MNPPMRLLSWININNIDWTYITMNSNAIDLLKKYPHKINPLSLLYNPSPWVIELIKNNFNKIISEEDSIEWRLVFINPNIIEILKIFEINIICSSGTENIILNSNKFLQGNKSIDVFDWHELCKNPYAIEIIETNLYNIISASEGELNIGWRGLSENPNAIHILESNRDLINWYYLSTNPKAVHLIDNTKYDLIDWEKISSNPSAIDLLEANPQRIDWKQLSTNLNAIHLLEANLERIDWSMLCRNPNAIHLLEANPERIDWNNLTINPNAIHLIRSQSNAKLFKSEFGWEGWWNYFIGYEKIETSCIAFLKNPAIFEWSRIKYLHKKHILHSILIKNMYVYIQDF